MKRNLAWQDRAAGLMSLWLIAAIIWGFASGYAAEVLAVSGGAIVVYVFVSQIRDVRRKEK